MLVIVVVGPLVVFVKLLLIVVVADCAVSAAYKFFVSVFKRRELVVDKTLEVFSALIDLVAQLLSIFNLGVVHSFGGRVFVLSFFSLRRVCCEDVVGVFCALQDLGCSQVDGRVCNVISNGLRWVAPAAYNGVQGSAGCTLHQVQSLRAKAPVGVLVERVKIAVSRRVNQARLEA